MDARGYRLGIDFGTSNTAAMLAWPDGHIRPLLFDGSPTLPSSVYADPQSGLLVGRDAVHAARVSPERFEPNPKRRIDEPSVLLGDHEFATVDLFAAVLARVAGEAQRVAGVRIGQVTITCPAAWAQTRRGVLVAAAERAGLGSVTLVPEPVAAAEVFRTLGGTDVRPGSAFVVYDLGAGTFDASVVRHGSGTFEVLAAEGLSTSGGLDIDAAIVGYLGASQSSRDPGSWNRLVHPTTSAERRANRLLWDDVRAAKEMLSRTSSTMIHIPMYDEDVPLGRDQFEQLARPILAATVTATRAAVAAARLNPADIAGVFLVGGGSRIPLVATLLHQALGKAPTAVEQPELVVAQGSLGVPAGAGPAVAAPVPGFPGSGSGSGSGSASFPTSAPPAAAFPASGPPSQGQPAAYPTSGPPSQGQPASYPTSGVPASGSVSMPVSGAPMSAAPVSPGFSAAPVSAQPVSGFPAAPVSGQPVSGFPASGYSGPQSGPSFGPPPGPLSSPFGTAQPPQPPPPGRAAVPSAYGAAAAPTTPAPAPAATPAAPAAPRRTGLLALVAILLVAVVGLGIYVIDQSGSDGGGQNAGGSQTGTPDGSGTDDSGGGDVTPADAEHEDTTWSSNAQAYVEYENKTIAYTCPSGGSAGNLWGIGPFTADSSVCTAAAYAGYITIGDGGRVVIKMERGQDSYEGGTQFEIKANSYGAYDWQFNIVGT